MSYSWAGMSNNMFPYSSSKQKIHIQEIMQVQVISHSRNRFSVCIIRPVCRTIFHIQERSIAERHLPGGFSKDERKVGPKNVRIKLLNFTWPNRKVNHVHHFLSNNAINRVVQKVEDPNMRGVSGFVEIFHSTPQRPVYQFP